MRPRQLSPQCGDNLGIGKSFGEANHMMQRFFGEALPEFCGQLSPQCGDSLLAVSGTLRSENILPDPAADLPVKLSQSAIRIICLKSGRSARGVGFAATRAVGRRTVFMGQRFGGESNLPRYAQYSLARQKSICRLSLEPSPKWRHLTAIAVRL